MSKETTEAANYYSKDFEWEQLRQEIETDSAFLYHLLPFIHDDTTLDKTAISEKGSVAAFSNSPTLQDSDAWNKFHSRHSTGKFFKERRYLLKEFPELATCRDNTKVLEVGCGNGSTALAILRATDNIAVYACDCSNEALDKAKMNIATANLIAAEHRFYPFLCDVSAFGFPKWLACCSCRDMFCKSIMSIPQIFTLSALPVHRMPMAIKECFSVLKPGGILLFRDYGLYDMTMLRFRPEQRVGYREYMRSDGTRSYFFSLECARDLFSSVGFTVLELEYCCVRSTNRRNEKIMRRVWVHGKFQKGKQSQI